MFIFLLAKKVDASSAKAMPEASVSSAMCCVTMAALKPFVQTLTENFLCQPYKQFCKIRLNSAVIQRIFFFHSSFFLVSLVILCYDALAFQAVTVQQMIILYYITTNGDYFVRYSLVNIAFPLHENLTKSLISTSQCSQMGTQFFK